MNKVVKGILMELNENSAVVMTKSGEFVKVRKPHSQVILGEEITSTVSDNSRSILKYAMMAAAIILLLLPFGYFKEAMAAVAYVNIDINPSLEVGINKYNRITDVIALNEDAKELLKNVSVDNLEVEKGVRAIIEGAEEMGYIREDKQNNIEITLIKVKENQVKVSEENLLEYAKDSLSDGDVDATVEVNIADKKDHDAAKKENISTNKYLDKYNKKSEKSIKAAIKKSAPSNKKKDMDEEIKEIPDGAQKSNDNKNTQDSKGKDKSNNQNSNGKKSVPKNNEINGNKKSSINSRSYTGTKESGSSKKNGSKNNFKNSDKNNGNDNVKK